MENLIKYVNNKNKQLLNSDFTFEYLFNVTCDQENRIFGEYIDNFKIVSVSYKELKSYSLKMASFFDASIKDKKNSFVGLYLENSINWVASFWGLLLSGYKVALLNPKLPYEVNKQVIKSLGINTVIASNTIFKDVNTIIIDANNKFIDNVLACEELRVKASANEIAICSTATSLNIKICIYTGYDITYQVLNAKSIIKANNMVKKHYQGRLKVLAFLPFYHIFGLIAAYFWFSLFGRTFVFLKDYAPETILNTIRRHNVTHVFAVPLLWNTIAKEVEKKIDAQDEARIKKIKKWMGRSIKIQSVFPTLGMKFSRKIFKEIIDKTLGDSIKFLISGGGEVADQTLLLVNAIGYPLFNGYGSTEIGITSVELRKKAKYRVLGTVGKPFKSVQYKIEDDCLLVKGTSTCSKIVYIDGNVQKLNKDEWYQTCDIAKIDNKGYYYISGRLDDVYVASTGEKYNPDLIEKQCLLKEVSNFSILNLKNKLTLIVQVEEDASLLAKVNVKTEVEAVVNRLRSEGYPLFNVYFTTDPLMNKNAIKVSRKLLTKNIDNGIITLHDFSLICSSDITEEAIEDEIVNKVSQVFSEVLNKDIKEIGLNQHFIFDLGGTSLDYISLLVKLKAAFNIEFNFDDASMATIKQFSKYIMNNKLEK